MFMTVDPLNDFLSEKGKLTGALKQVAVLLVIQNELQIWCLRMSSFHRKSFNPLFLIAQIDTLDYAESIGNTESSLCMTNLIIMDGIFLSSSQISCDRNQLFARGDYHPD
jgi:hypothetical protein